MVAAFIFFDLQIGFEFADVGVVQAAGSAIGTLSMIAALPADALGFVYFSFFHFFTVV